jgi:hypothetical protein
LPSIIGYTIEYINPLKTSHGLRRQSGDTADDAVFF